MFERPRNDLAVSLRQHKETAVSEEADWAFVKELQELFNEETQLWSPLFRIR